MNGVQFLEHAKKNGVEVWKEGERLKYRAQRELPPKAIELLKTLKSELLPLVEDRADPFERCIMVYRVLRGEALIETILPLLKDPETDANLRLWIQRAFEGWGYDDSGSPVSPTTSSENRLGEYADLLTRARAGLLVCGREILLSGGERCEDLNRVVLLAEERYRRFNSSKTLTQRNLATRELEALYRAKKAQESLETEGLA